MAHLAASNFTVTDSWHEADKTGKNTLLVKKVTITTGTAGTAANSIPASVFGMETVWTVDVCGVDNADPGNYTFQPSYDGTLIYAINTEQATDANRGDPADVVFADFKTKLLIKGKEA